MKKILIIVLASNNDYYAELINIIKSTWAKKI